MNNKGLNWTLVALIIIAILVIAAVVVGISMSGSAPAVGEQPVTVYINGEKQTGNYTQKQVLIWESAAEGWSYQKNFTVVNNLEQALTIQLLTTSPSGTNLTWTYNNTAIEPEGFAGANLAVDSYKSGTYTWRLLAFNGSSAMPTPTPSATPGASPSPTPTPNALNFTVDAELGVKNITITVNNKTPVTEIFNNLPVTYTFTSGDTLKFEVSLDEGYLLKGWQFEDLGVPINENPLTLTDKTVSTHTTLKNFTITALIQ